MILSGKLSSSVICDNTAPVEGDFYETTPARIQCEGTVDRKDGATRFTDIILRPRLTIPAAGDRGRALKLLEKSEKACLVSASLLTPIRLEPEVVFG